MLKCWPIAVKHANQCYWSSFEADTILKQIGAHQRPGKHDNLWAPVNHPWRKIYTVWKNRDANNNIWWMYLTPTHSELSMWDYHVTLPLQWMAYSSVHYTLSIQMGLRQVSLMQEKLIITISLPCAANRAPILSSMTDSTCITLITNLNVGHQIHIKS